ncbi:MAG: GNAT family protein [Aliarcobacter butzleri]|nr:GNAT family protein [Aliarcobacter butzleri]
MTLENNDIALIPFSDLKNNQSLKVEYLGWLNNKNVTTSINSFELLKHKNLSFIEESFKRFTSVNCQGYFIFIKKDKKFIGTIKIDKIDLFRKSAEIGLMIGNTDYYGKNYGFHSLKLLVNHCFVNLKLHRIWGGTDENNLAMRKIFTKLNFKQEGISRDANYISNTYSDNILYSILSNEYEH